MAKLSATAGSDPETITRVDITPEMIRAMSPEALEELLKKIRGNREVSASKPKRERGSGPKTVKDDEGGFFDE